MNCEVCKSADADDADWVYQFLIDVRNELERARAWFPGDRGQYIALAEEVGELARALLEQNGSSVWEEAVQVAVMAARVAIDGDSSIDALRMERGLNNHRKGRT